MKKIVSQNLQNLKKQSTAEVGTKTKQSGPLRMGQDAGQVSIVKINLD